MTGIRLGAGLALAAALAAGAAVAGPLPFGHGHGKAKKAEEPAIPKASFWKLAAGASQQIFVNRGKSSVQVVAYVCVDPKLGKQPVVDIRMIGRPAIETPGTGCQSAYLQVDSGEWIALTNPGPDAISGSYKVDQSG